MSLGPTSPRPYIVASSGAASAAPVGSEPIRLFGLSGGATVLTGYVIGAVAKAPVAATDTVTQAIAKLEKRILDLENAAP